MKPILVTKEVSAALEAPGRTRKQARSRLHRLRAAKIIPPLGVEGNNQRATWTFDRRVVQAAAVLFELMDGAGIVDAERLRAAFNVFATPHKAGDDAPTIDYVMADIERGGEPVLCVTYWSHFTGAWVTSFAVRLGDEYEVPIMSPGDGWEPAFDGVLKLAPILARFLDNADNVVPLRSEAR